MSEQDGPISAPEPRGLALRLRRWLELERSFGWKPPIRSLKRSGAREVPAAPPSTRPSADSRPTPSPRATRSAETSGGGGPARRGPPRPKVDPPVPAAVALQSGASPEEVRRRESLLAPVRAEVAACTQCGLGRGRTQSVFGVGNPCARLVLVGEAPGFDEDQQGEPFVGAAGRLLNDILRAMRLRREDVYIANVIKCRPPRNRTPDPEEVATCLPYLRRQLDVIRPQVICALGSVASRGLLGTASSLGALRGRFHDLNGVAVRVTYHPAYLLRYPAAKRQTWDDVRAVAKHLGIELS